MSVIYILLAIFAYVFIGGVIHGLIDPTRFGKIVDPEVWMFIWPLCLLVFGFCLIGETLRTVYDFGKKVCVEAISKNKK